MPAAPNIAFNQLQVPQNFTQDEISQLQQAVGTTRQGTDQLNAVNQLLGGLSNLRSIGAHADVFQRQFANVLDQLAAPGRNEANMGIAAARDQANRTLASGLNELNAAIDVSKRAGAVQGINTDPGAGDLLNKAAAGDTVAKQALSERISNANQLASQQQQLGDFQRQAQQQYFGTTSTGGNAIDLNQALSSTGGQLGQLNQFLGTQEANTFNTQLKPLIQMALGARGLSDSGAQIELQSKALAQLEQARQQNMMQAALGAQGNINSLQYSALTGGLGQAQQNLNSQFDLQRAGITMQYQQQLESQREQLAYQLSQRQGGGGGGLGSLIGMGLGAGVGALVPGGGAMGAMIGAGLGSSLGGGIGNQINPGYNGMLGAQLGSTFFAGANAIPMAQKQQYFKPVAYAPGGDMMGQGVLK